MFKVTKVNSQIRKSSLLCWYKDEHSDYILNGYWLIKTDLKKEEYRKMLSILVEMFGAIPKVGEELKRTTASRNNKISKSEVKPSWLEFLEEQDLANLEDTRLTHLLATRGSCRVFKGNDYIYINCEYIEMFNEDLRNNRFEGSGPLKPVFVKNKDDLIMLMPVRIGEGNQHLKDITTDEIKKDSQGLQSQKSQ